MVMAKKSLNHEEHEEHEGKRIGQHQNTELFFVFFVKSSCSSCRNLGSVLCCPPISARAALQRGPPLATIGP